MISLIDAIKSHDPVFPQELRYPPTGEVAQHYGMSRRDYFAAAALTGILSSKRGGCDGPLDDAKKAYQYADAMLAAGKGEK